MGFSEEAAHPSCWSSLLLCIGLVQEWERSSEAAGAHCSVDALQAVGPKRRAVPGRCCPGSCKEQVKCAGHSGAGSTQKRASGVGHQIKVFASITSR